MSAVRKRVEAEEQQALVRPRIDASLINGLLAAKHALDVFVPECKNGSTWGGSYRVLDAWAMEKSWSPWTTVGYEIKVSRSDFEQDQKWPEYLACCHEFYFVCPGGLIKATDLPKGVGVIWVSANGKRLHTKVKAGRRKPEPDALCALMSYVLMSRTRIVRDMHEANSSASPAPDDRVSWLAEKRRWVEEHKDRESLSVLVNEHVRSRFAEQELRLKEIEHRVALADEFRAKLERAGVRLDFDDWRSRMEAERQIDRLAGRLPDGLENELSRLAEAMSRMATQVKEIRGQTASEPTLAGRALREEPKP